MPTLKTPQEIIDEMCRKPEECHSIFDKAVAKSSRERLASAMRSLLEGVMEKMPRKLNTNGECEHRTLNTIMCGVCRDVDRTNRTIEACRSSIQSVIDSIKE